MSAEPTIDAALEAAVLGGLARQPDMLDVVTPDMFFVYANLADALIPALRLQRMRGEPSYRYATDGGTLRLEFRGLSEALNECGSLAPDTDAARFEALVPDGWIRPSDPARLRDLARRRRLAALADELQRDVWSDDRVRAITTELARLGSAA